MSTEVEQLRRWKAEALPVIAGLQEVGRALGLRLGTQITGRDAVDAALDLRNKRDRATEQLATARRAVADEVANLADDGARLSHGVVRRLEAVLEVTRDGA